MNTTRWILAAGTTCACLGAAQAQDAGLSASIGLRAWATQWTTFSYIDLVGDKDADALVQSSAGGKLVLIPVLGVRWGDFTGSLSVMPATSFSFPASRGTRQEWDLNLGYTLMPGLTATLGYKRVSQRDGRYRYEPRGPMLGLNANAQINGPLSMYGIFGLGKLKTPPKRTDWDVDFEADYRLAELGLAYALDVGRPSPRVALTGGWRIQTMGSREAFGNQDGRDTTQGLTLGAVATF
jgi:hypothetical protein